MTPTQPPAAPDFDNPQFILDHANSYADAHMNGPLEAIGRELENAGAAIEQAKRERAPRPKLRELMHSQADVRQAQKFALSVKAAAAEAFISGALWMKQLIPRSRD